MNKLTSLLKEKIGKDYKEFDKVNYIGNDIPANCHTNALKYKNAYRGFAIVQEKNNYTAIEHSFNVESGVVQEHTSYKSTPFRDKKIIKYVGRRMN